MNILIFSLTILLTGFMAAGAQEEYVQAPAAIQISSTVSDGKLSVPEIVEACRKNNIKVIMLADRDFMNWEYGLWPLRRIIKKIEHSNSVSTYGVKRYFKEIEALQNKNKDLILIPGIESAPFYYWQGNPFGGSFKILDWHKHILVFGLEHADDYNNLPSVSNSQVLMRPYVFKDVYLFWPVLVLLAGIFFFSARRGDYRDSFGRRLGPYSKKKAFIGAILMITGVLFLLNNFPFRSFKYDQYHGGQGIKPYQNFIDYVKQKGALVFWAHPEAENIQKIGRVNIETKEYAENLFESFDYTGFAIFYEGYKKIGLPGGIWDELLKQYCLGQRKEPVWAIAGLSFDQTGDLAAYLRDLRTIVLPDSFGKDAVLAALKRGKMYVLRGKESSRFILDAFTAADASIGIKKTMGEEIKINQAARLKIKGHFLHGQDKLFKIKLIKNGNIIKDFEINSPFDIFYDDESVDQNKKGYYRIEAQCDGLQLITNPIFVSVL